MKIVMISPTPRAGTPQYCHALASALADRGHSVIVVTSLNYEFADRQPNYEVLEVFDRFRIRPRRVYNFLRRLRAFDPDLIHFIGAQHPKTYLGMCRFLLLFTSCTYVYSPLDVYSNKENASEKRVFTKLYGLMAHSFANNQRQAATMVEQFGVPREQISVFPMPDLSAPMRDVIPEAVPDLSDDALLVLCFGLIQPRKGIGVLIEAFAQVIPQVPHAKLAIVGHAIMDVAPYHEQIDALGLRDHVVINPTYVSFELMAGYFERAQIVALPYIIGWTSGALATAFGYGKPVVATEVDAMTEVVRDGENGLLVPPGDAEALAAAMVRMMQDEALYAHLVTGAVETGHETSWPAKAKNTEAAYAKVLAGPS